MYLGFIKRGIIILIVGFSLSFFVPLFISFPWSWVIVIGYWVWQITDAYEHYKKLSPKEPEVAK